MTIEIKPVGNRCHMACSYCYQEPMRDSGNTAPVQKDERDLEKMLSVASGHGAPFTVYGGEALLTPKNALRRIFQFGLEHWNSLPEETRASTSPNGIQTNGDLIDDEHLDMFEKYGVSVGVSCDGPGTLNNNRVRRRGSEPVETTTDRTLTNIARCREKGISVSVIATLHQLNGLGHGLDRLLSWGRELADIGVWSVNVHSLEIEAEWQREALALTDEEEVVAFLTMARWLEENPDLRWSPFRDIRSRLEWDKNPSNCVWHKCDPLTTEAVYGVEADGSLSNCGRTSKDGVAWRKTETIGFERYLSLYQSPQEYGGCKDCRFFVTCGGSCPGEGQRQDWRNRTEHCSSIMALSKFYEKRIQDAGGTPVSLSPNLPMIESALISSLERDENPTLVQLANAESPPRDSHSGYAPHGDKPHGDKPHGDHTDAALT